MVILREPVARALSQHAMNTRRRLESLGFADAVAAEPERTATDALLPHGRPARNLANYIERGLYAAQLRALVAAGARTPILVLFTESLESSPGPSLALLHDFLALAERPRGEFPHANRNVASQAQSTVARDLLPHRVLDSVAAANAELASWLGADDGALVAVAPDHWPPWLGVRST